MEHQILIEPWTQYDDQLRPWWIVRVEGERGRFNLSWTSSNGGRWSDSNELRRLKGRSGRLLFRVNEVVRAAFASVTEPPASVTAERDDSLAGSVTSLARARGGFAYCHGCHAVTVTPRDVTEHRDSSGRDCRHALGRSEEGSPQNPIDVTSRTPRLRPCCACRQIVSQQGGQIRLVDGLRRFVGPCCARRKGSP